MCRAATEKGKGARKGGTGPPGLSKRRSRRGGETKGEQPLRPGQNQDSLHGATGKAYLNIVMLWRGSSVAEASMLTSISA